MSNYISQAQYLHNESESPLRHEYFKGEVLKMPATGPGHNIIKENLVIESGSQLKKENRCKTYSSVQRVFIPSNGFFAYPDVLIVCGQTLFSLIDKNSILNPQVIIEVFTESSQGYDRTEKFFRYKEIEGLRYYMLVNASAVGVEVYCKKQDNWKLDSFEDNLAMHVRLGLLNLNFSVRNIYSDSPNIETI